MAIKFIKQTEPPTDPNRSQIYEDSGDNHPKVKNSGGVVTDLMATVGRVFGENFAHASSVSESSTTSTSFQNKVTLTVNIPENGIYLINFFYNWGYKSTSNDFIGKVMINDVTLVSHREEPKDSGNDQEHCVSGCIPASLDAGNNVIKIQYRSSSSSYAAIIKNAYLSTWRAL